MKHSIRTFKDCTGSKNLVPLQYKILYINILVYKILKLLAIVPDPIHSAFLNTIWSLLCPEFHSTATAKNSFLFIFVFQSLYIFLIIYQDISVLLKKWK